MPSFTDVLIVFIGGGIGSVLRFTASLYITLYLAETRLAGHLPVATLSVNVLGSLLIGVVVALAGEHLALLSPSARLLLAVGFCGGFTTFSTFSLETLSLVQTGRLALAVTYVLLSIIFCPLATASGLGITYWYWKRLSG
ncbi:MAG: fluoride efflux transporter CrcB [Bacteroidota bacterium]|nr:fluoride efflux transporter CrcB [Candidatus Kapabacteria bacterium]MDW8220971.1 fluoride efflux transporter CrcB [Bacteroidota bacterium]